MLKAQEVAGSDHEPRTLLKTIRVLAGRATGSHAGATPMNNLRRAGPTWTTGTDKPEVTD